MKNDEAFWKEEPSETSHAGTDRDPRGTVLHRLRVARRVSPIRDGLAEPIPESLADKNDLETRQNRKAQAMNLSRTATFCVLALASARLAGCSNSDGYACPQWVAPPNAQLLYPEPGATGVPHSFGILVFAGGVGESPAPIGLGVGTLPDISTSPTALPSPLPSPAATPMNYGAPLLQIFAVTVPALEAGRTYNVFAPAASGCRGNFEQAVGSFSTR